jgi:predicted metal-binding protein
MTKHCINHARVTYDCCRSCQGKDINCPEYLSDIEHTRQVTENLYKVRKPSFEGSQQTAEIYHPIEYRRLNLLEKQLTTRFFLQRFYRSQLT